MNFDDVLLDHAQQLDSQGWTLFPSVLSQSSIKALQQDLETAYTICRQVQIQNGISANTDGTVHHLLGIADSFLKLLEELPFIDFMQRYFFRGKFILNTYGGVLNFRDKPAYVCNMHRDIRFFSGDFPLMLNMLVMLDEFTLENGATYLLNGSHKVPERPDEAMFFEKAHRVTGPTGSILFFNSNLWHAAGQNTTDQVRRCLTLCFTKPFMKQQLDYTRTLGEKYVEALPEHLKQIIGYNSRVPTNLEEWYQPPENRFYKPGQDAEDTVKLQIVSE